MDGEGFNPSGLWGAIWTTLLTVGLPYLGMKLRQIQKLETFTKTARITKGILGTIAEQYPHLTIVEMTDSAVQQIMDRMGISKAAAVNAVNSVKVELGLPMNGMAETMTAREFFIPRPRS